MLGLMLMTNNDGRRLDPGLAQLARVVGDGIRVLVIDKGSQDDTLARLRRFGEKVGDSADILRLEDPQLDMQAALVLARAQLNTPYVLGLTGQDMICPAAIAPLVKQLKSERPDLMICNHGWWVAGPRSVLPCADAGRMAALAEVTPGNKPEIEPETLRALLADPRRLLAGPDIEIVPPEAKPGPDLGQTLPWDVYDNALDTVLAQAGRISVFTDPVLLRPIPVDQLAEMFGWVTAQLRACSGRACADLLARVLPRLGDEMALYDPGRAGEVLAAVRQLYGALPWGLRRRVAGLAEGPAVRVLGALQQGGEPAALAVLSGLAVAQDRARMLALSAEIQALREDVDLALPGPEYLMELYERVRPT